MLFDYALSFPHRLRSLVIVNSLGGVQDPDYVAMWQRIRPSPQFGALPVEVRELGPSYRAANPEGTSRRIQSTRRSQQSQPRAPQRARNQITFSKLETIRLPVLLITGDADLYTPPSVLKLFSARIKGAQSLVIPECGHSAYWEQPEAFNHAVLEFLKKSEQGPARSSNRR